MKLDSYKKNIGKKTIYVVRKVDELESVHAAIVFNFIKNDLQVVEFHSKRRGIVKYHFSDHSISGHTWESEDNAQKVSDLNYHFTGFVLNESSAEPTNLNIISEVVHSLLEVEITNIVRKLLEAQDPTKEIFEYFKESKA